MVSHGPNTYNFPPFSSGANTRQNTAPNAPRTLEEPLKRPFNPSHPPNPEAQFAATLNERGPLATPISHLKTSKHGDPEATPTQKGPQRPSNLQDYIPS